LTKSELLSVDIDGPVRYVDYGGAGKPPMVMVHGIGGSQLNWVLVAPQLAEPYHVFALDLVGFGMTPLAGRKATIDNNQQIVNRFIEQVVGGPAIVMGHSMGGLIAMLQGARSPANTTTLLLVDPAVPPTRSPAPGLPSSLLDALSRAPRVGGAIGGLMPRLRGAETIVRESLRHMSAPGVVIDESFMHAHIEQEAVRMRTRHAYLGYMQAWASFPMDDIDRYDRDIVMPVTQPTLLIEGAIDPVVLPEGIRRIAALRPDWTVRFIDGVGHSPQIEKPDEFVAIVLDWLSRVHAPVA
jgi:pimeloyl-ACP methyl ester carboxylesterase